VNRPGTVEQLARHEVVLVRHAETEWSISGRHTGRTDIPLTEHGRELARALAERMSGWDFGLVLASPLLRARETCELCGLGAIAQVRPDLLEWDYGDYEGLTTPQIRAERPDWNLWRDGCPGGEDIGEVSVRVDRVIDEIAGVAGPSVVFSHGHLLRVLGARWIGLGGERGARLGLSTGSICVLGAEHGERILGCWNDARGASARPIAAG
jgi:broad specificity phosphatase PhoE